jgi:retron-type reverse transcriptase
LFNPALYLLAYGRLAKNKGAMTPGVTAETADGMSLAKIDTVIGALRFERFRWAPVRRTYIPRKNGKMRPLGLPTWSSKLLQEVIRLILEAYYEPQFSDHSHGFRPTRGCHTALSTIHNGWTGSTWLIEGDISACFDSLDHEILLTILAEKIHDGRFLRLIADLLKAGYLEEWTFGRTLSGVPQGGVVTPPCKVIWLYPVDHEVGLSSDGAGAAPPSLKRLGFVRKAAAPLRERPRISRLWGAVPPRLTHKVVGDSRRTGTRPASSLLGRSRS